MFETKKNSRTSYLHPCPCEVLIKTSSWQSEELPHVISSWLSLKEVSKRQSPSQTGMGFGLPFYKTWFLRNGLRKDVILLWDEISTKIWKSSFFFRAQRFVVSRQRWSRQLCLPHAAARQKQSYQEENSSEKTRPQSRVQREVLHYLCYPHMLLLNPSNILSVVIFYVSYRLKVWVCSSCGRAEIQTPQCVSEE